MTPEDIFEHRWALVVIDQVLAKLEREEMSAGNGRQYEKLPLPSHGARTKGRL